MDCTNWFYLCLTLCGVILAMLAMFFNYSLKLGWRTAKLEKKNGHELDRIIKLEAKQKQADELQEKLKKFEQKFSESN